MANVWSEDEYKEYLVSLNQWADNNGFAYMQDTCLSATREVSEVATIGMISEEAKELVERELAWFYYQIGEEK